MMCKSWNSAARFPIMPCDEARSTPPRAGPLLFLALKGRKTLDLNHVLKVTSVDLATVLIWCKLWPGLSAGAHFAGIVGGGNPIGRAPALPYVHLESPAALCPLYAIGRSLREESGRGDTWIVLWSRRNIP